MIAHSPQPCYTDLGTGWAARHKVPQATWISRAVQIFKLLATPGGEERETLVERYLAAGCVPGVGGIAWGAAEGQSSIKSNFLLWEEEKPTSDLEFAAE